jgi:hypothetical protein
MYSSIIASALVATSVSAFTNSVPVYGTYPGWVLGSNAKGIFVEIYLDLLCSDCQDQNPVWNELLTTSWLDGTV